MKYDKANNPKESCQFETLLAHHLFTNPAYFSDLYKKIFTAIEGVIQFNEDNMRFKRFLFSVYTQVKMIFPGMDNLEMIRSSGNIIVYCEFLKRFFEMLLAQPFCKVPALKPQSKLPSLSELCYLTLHKNPKAGSIVLSKHIRSTQLFSKKNRGAKQKRAVRGSINTKKFGILLEEDTPKKLKSYFDQYFVPAQNLFTPVENSYVAKWLRLHKLPVISGTSGSTEIALSNLSKIVWLNKSEQTIFVVSLAVALISRGHHSFLEVMLPLSRLGYNITEHKSTRAFYEQFFSKTITNSRSYSKFIRSAEVISLLHAIDNDKHQEQKNTSDLTMI